MKDALKQIVEWYLGVEESAPGEGTAWTWHTGGWLVSVPTWLLLVVAVAVVTGVVLVYRRDARALSRRQRWTLVTLRLAVFVLLCALLFQVSLSIDRTDLPRLVVLIDDSGSMLFQDDYTATDDERAVAELSTDGEGVTRLQIAKRLLSERSVNLLRRLQQKYRVRLYRFSDQARPLEVPEGAATEEVIAAIDQLQADGQVTAPAAAARQVLDEFRGDPPTAVVMLTDGVSSAGDENRLTQIAASPRGVAVPFYIVAVGSTKAASDLELTDVRTDDIAIVDQTILFTGELSAQGFEGREVVLEIRDTASDTRLAAQRIRIRASRQPVELTYVPAEAGEYDYSFGVVPLDEEHIVENNVETRHVSVRDGRIRVLLVDTLPRYEYRYIKTVLGRSEGRAGAIDLNTVLFDADPEWTALDSTAAPLRGRIPTAPETLNEYDVIILGDVNPDLLGPKAQRALRDFVREKGGGLVLIAGPRFMPHAYRNTQLETLIPAPLDGITGADYRLLGQEGLGFEPTLSGRRGTSLFRFGETDSESTRALARLPNLYASLQLSEVDPAANVLAVENTEALRPLIVSRQYGAGRVVLHATDDLWMWRYRAGDSHHGRYWVSLVRYLSRSSLLGRDRTAELMTNRETYERGENVEFQLRFLDSRNQPADGVCAINVERRGGASQTLELRPSSRFPELYTGVLAAPADGSYHAWVSRPGFDNAPPSTDFRVQNSARELLIRDIDQSGMQAAVKATRGRYYSPANAELLPEQLPSGRAVTMEASRPIAIWSRPELLLIFVGLLAAEWFLRKKARLI